MKNFFSFLTIWIKKPKEVKAWFPTSKRIARKVAAFVPADAKRIAEYGPGPGTVTQAILSRLGPAAEYTAIEILPEFIESLKKINDQRLEVIEGDVLEFQKKFKPESFDVILTSIPTSNLSEEEREILVETSKNALRPGGMFIVYYQMQKLSLPTIQKYFDHVEETFMMPIFTPYYIFVAKK